MYGMGMSQIWSTARGVHWKLVPAVWHLGARDAKLSDDCFVFLGIMIISFSSLLTP